MLFTYSSKGRRELPNAQVYVDGPVEPLSKDGSFLGRHVYTRLPGVAVQINAFNFPVWGSLEKFAPAFLAGVPTPREAGDADRLPRRGLGADPRRVGAAARRARCSSCRGSVPDAVRPPAARRPRRRSPAAPRRPSGCARTTRCRPAACASRARPTRSTPRCSVRMPSPGTPEFDAYVQAAAGRADDEGRAEVHRDPPRDRAGRLRRCRRRRPARAKIAERVVIGDPRAEGVTMGPLVSLEQRDEVLRRSRALEAAGGRIVIGIDRRARGRARRRLDAAPPPTARSSRRCCCGFTDASAAAVHEVEAFGPVASVLAYDDGRRRPRDLVAPRRRIARDERRDPRSRRSRSSCSTGIARVQRPRAVPRPRRRAHLDRPRLAGAAPRARRTRPRRRRRGARRHPRRAAPHAAHGDPGLARDAHRAHRRLARGCGVAARRAASVPQVARRAARSATRSSRRRAR